MINQAQAALDALSGAVYFNCAICGVEEKRGDGTWRNVDDWCCRCYEMDINGEPGRGAFRLYHLARRSLRRVFCYD